MELQSQEQSLLRTTSFSDGLARIVSMYRPESKANYQIKTHNIIKTLGELHEANPKNQGFLFDFNVYQLANVVITQLSNLVLQGFEFRQKDNSLAYAIIHMIQINTLWHCCECKQVKERGGELTKRIYQLIQELKKDVIYCLYNSQTNLDKFQLVDPDFKNVLKQVLLDKEKYLRTASYHQYPKQLAFNALHQIYLNILAVLRRKIKLYLLKPEKQTKQNIFFFCDRIYLKLSYLHVATNNYFNRQTIRQLARTSEQPSKLASCIYLLDSPSGLVKILNYFEQAPTSALINDKHFLKIRFKQTESYER